MHYPLTYRKSFHRAPREDTIVVLTFDNPAKALCRPQTTCHPQDIVHIQGNALIHSSRKRCHWLYYPAPGPGSLRARGCTDANHELRQYREDHLVVGPTTQELNFRVCHSKEEVTYELSFCQNLCKSDMMISVHMADEYTLQISQNLPGAILIVFT